MADLDRFRGCLLGLATDDTSMALYLATSLIEQGGFDANRWLRS